MASISVVCNRPLVRAQRWPWRPRRRNVALTPEVEVALDLSAALTPETEMALGPSLAQTASSARAISCSRPGWGRPQPRHRPIFYPETRAPPESRWTWPRPRHRPLCVHFWFDGVGAPLARRAFWELAELLASFGHFHQNVHVGIVTCFETSIPRRQQATRESHYHTMCLMGANCSYALSFFSGESHAEA